MHSVQAQTVPAPVLPPAVQVFALGGFRVVVRGRPVDEAEWRRRSARQLFKCLLSRPSRRMTRDEVIDLFWPDSDPEAAASNLRSTLHALRRVLEPPETGAALGVVFGDRHSVWLRQDVEVWLDADAFERDAEAARTASDPLPLLEQASALYSGDYLPDDLYEDWADERRARLKGLWADVHIRLARTLEGRGEAESAVGYIQRVVQADPCDERAAQEAMQLLARLGRRSDALRVYQRLVQALEAELGVEPSEASQAIWRQITAGERIEPPAGTAFRSTYRFPEPTSWIDRERELGLLERLLAAGRSSGQTALIGAPAGIGKSALVGQLVSRAQAKGVLCLAGGCYEEGTALPLAPFRDALADYLLAQPPASLRAELGSTLDDLALVVPELRAHLELPESTAASETRLDRGRAFGAIHACLRKLAERGPVLACLEDLHVADEATLQVFHYLARQTRRLPLVLVGTYRSDETTADEPVGQTLLAMQRQRLVEHLTPAPLGPADTESLVEALLSGSTSHSLSASVFETSGGNPLFVEQLVLALSEGGQLQRRGGVWDGAAEMQSMPQLVREVIGLRLARLSATCREMVAVAAVLGQSFEHRVLVRALDPLDEQQLLVDLDQAIAAQVLEETASGYTFKHALVREAAYWRLSAPRRMLLHGRVGELLERLYGAAADEHAAELGHHFARAGASRAVRTKALHYTLLAGRHAAELSSYPEAFRSFVQACELIDADPELADRAQQAHALAGRGEAEANLALWTDCAQTFRRVLELADEPLVRAQAHGRIAFAQFHLGHMGLVLDECNAALEELRALDGPEAAAARLYPQQLIAVVRYLQGRYQEVVQMGREMQANTAALDESKRTILDALVLGWGYMGQGHVDEALAAYAPGLAVGERLGHKVLHATMHENIGFQHYLGGRFATAREHLTRALLLYDDSASELRAVNALQHLCRTWVAEGELDRARQRLQQAVELQVQANERWAADGHHILGEIQSVRGEWDAAAHSFELALATRRAVGDTCGIVESSVGLGVVQQHRGAWLAALEAFNVAVAVAERMDPAPCRVLALRQRGRLRLVRGEDTAAAQDIERALATVDGMRQTLEYAPTLLAAAQLQQQRGDLDAALALATSAVEQARPVEQRIEAQIVLAGVQIGRGQVDAGLAGAESALAEATRLGAPRLQCLARLELARAEVLRGSPDAERTFAAALDAAEAARTPFERAAVLGAVAHYLATRPGQAQRAAAYAAEARSILRRLGRHPDVPTRAVER